MTMINYYLTPGLLPLLSVSLRLVPLQLERENGDQSGWDSYFNGDPNMMRTVCWYQHEILCKYASLRCADDHVTKSRNQKSIRVTSSNKRLKHKCVDLSDQCRYFNPIWYRAQIPQYSHNPKIQNGGRRHLKFWKNINNFGLDKDICTKFYGIMHWTLTQQLVLPYKPWSRLVQ